jgi:hypothetical protein
MKGKTLPANHIRLLLQLEDTPKNRLAMIQCQIAICDFEHMVEGVALLKRETVAIKELRRMAAENVITQGA